MKIIRKGEIPKQQEKNFYEAVCQNCHTVFWFEENEAKLVRVRDIYNPIHEGKVECPLCKNIVDMRDWVKVDTEGKRL